LKEGEVQMDSRLTRRDFIGKAIFIGSAVVLGPYSVWKFSKNENETLLLGSLSSGTIFNDAQRRLLAGFAEIIFPGAVKLGAVEYIDTLMTAFETNPPKIYASGPYSNRQPFSDNGKITSNFSENSFATFMSLTRHQEAAWRYKLYGSKGLPGGGPNDRLLGDQKGLREILSQGLHQALAKNREPLPHLTLGGAKSLFNSATDKEFQQSLTELVLEGCFAAPEYGGNKKQAGWQMVQFEGDSQPLGYSMYDENRKIYVERPDSPLSTPNPVPDDQDHRLSPRVRFVLFAIVQARKMNL
jgi:Gluconate 2-dehydrogenase subunit 3